jgi:methionine aminopeptidase
MSSPDNALQAGIYDRLTGYAPLTSALGGQKVYDFVSAKLVAPYVVIGEDTLSDWDTKTNSGWDCTVTIHAWDFLKAGRKSVKTLLSLIHDALHRQESEIVVAGFTLTEIRRDFQQTIQETGIEGENDHYYHGIARYRALLETT